MSANKICPKCRTITEPYPQKLPKGYDPALTKYVCPSCHWVWFVNMRGPVRVGRVRRLAGISSQP